VSTELGWVLIGLPASGEAMATPDAVARESVLGESRRVGVEEIVLTPAETLVEWCCCAQGTSTKLRIDSIKCLFLS